MSKSNKEVIINTNISGIMPDPKFRHNTFVTEIEPYGFRLTMMGFTITENTTFICKVTKSQKTLFVELGTVIEIQWYYYTNSWQLFSLLKSEFTFPYRHHRALLCHQCVSAGLSLDQSSNSSVHFTVVWRLLRNSYSVYKNIQAKLKGETFLYSTQHLLLFSILFQSSAFTVK